MGMILSKVEAENVLHQLPEKEIIRINNDKIRCGEYFIGHDQDNYFRVDPINVIIKEGSPVNIYPNAITII